MKLNQALKREFNHAVAARLAELMAEQVEQVAQAQLKALVNGHGAHKKAAHAIKYPPYTVLKRGDREALKHFRMTTKNGLLANAAWEALAKDGHFASKATRADMTAYLVKSVEGVTPSQVSATLSLAIQRGLLVAVQ